jgi:ferric-dicitrate binding protein FerR (iron transport regulator)
MTKADHAVEKSAVSLDHLAGKAADRHDGVGQWLAKELKNDAAFLRKLKPSLIKARAQSKKGKEAPSAPSGPQLAGSSPKKKRRNRKAPPPVVIVGAALVAGVVVAKVISWRANARD